MSSTGTVVLVQGGGSNLGSVRYAFDRIGVATHVTSDAAEISSADRVVFPGVGTAASAMQRLASAGLTGVLRSLTQPVLGICLGMQLLYESSEEGDTACLGVIPGRIERFRPAPGLRVPHMGWNRLEHIRDEPLLHGVQGGAHVYFVHSFQAPVTHSSVATSLHGQEFTAAVRHGNFTGAQFHPERSGNVGARILKNFLELR